MPEEPESPYECFYRKMDYNIVSRFPSFDNKTQFVWKKIKNKNDLEFFEEMALNDSLRYVNEL